MGSSIRLLPWLMRFSFEEVLLCSGFVDGDELGCRIRVRAHMVIINQTGLQSCSVDWLSAGWRGDVAGWFAEEFCFLLWQEK